MGPKKFRKPPFILRFVVLPFCQVPGQLSRWSKLGRFDIASTRASTRSADLLRQLRHKANRRFDTLLRHFDTASTSHFPCFDTPPLLLGSGGVGGFVFKAKRHPARQTARSASTDAARFSRQSSAQ
jgi:hypothetical protein